MFSHFRKKFIGDKAFYKMILTMVVPMILQMMITNLVSLIDNIMVGRLGTEPMSGVSVVNQFIFVFNVTIFGAVAGPSIFGAQFFGKGDHEGQKYTFRFRLIVCAAIITIAAAVFSLFGSPLISLFISKESEPEQASAILKCGSEYLRIIIIGLIPFGIGQAYSSVIRECGETKIPMIGAMSAIGINVLLDYGLIFGKLGMPELGVRGAAWATVIAKTFEALVVIVWAHTHHDRNKYIIGLFRGFHIPSRLIADITKKGILMLVNEFLWSLGMSVVMQCYSVRSTDVVAARNISSTMTNLFSSIYVQMGACIAIIVGARLGANKLKEARDLDNKLLFFAVVSAAAVGLVTLPLAPLFPQFYNTEDNIRDLAAYMIMIQAAAMPMWSYTNACYFTLRSGGKTGITFLFDFGFTWLIMIPLAAVLSYCTHLDIRIVFAVVTLSEVIKVAIGYFMVRSNIWINNIVDDI
ncbi:MAG: MATE family efflux transporter [Ruminococcus sp.]|uniref:MATE family efflux transporter n=1 Tax=Ruminococcus sp. TaxID=41978 RepID=UPI0025D9C8E9|nr:MATE family efflux transporter [Ruminococcus sp.]MCR5599609.1 MATE family efflux transporter [Ruminococcus sp.]